MQNVIQLPPNTQKAPTEAGAFVDLFAGQCRVWNQITSRLTAPLPTPYDAPRIT
jgi:hypothetical protein